MQKSTLLMADEGNNIQMLAKNHDNVNIPYCAFLSDKSL